MDENHANAMRLNGFNLFAAIKTKPFCGVGYTSSHDLRLDGFMQYVLLSYLTYFVFSCQNLHFVYVHKSWATITLTVMCVNFCGFYDTLKGLIIIRSNCANTKMLK